MGDYSGPESLEGVAAYRRFHRNRLRAELQESKAEQDAPKLDVFEWKDVSEIDFERFRNPSLNPDEAHHLDELIPSHEKSEHWLAPGKTNDGPSSDSLGTYRNRSKGGQDFGGYGVDRDGRFWRRVNGIHYYYSPSLRKNRQ